MSADSLGVGINKPFREMLGAAALYILRPRSASFRLFDGCLFTRDNLALCRHEFLFNIRHVF